MKLKLLILALVLIALGAGLWAFVRVRGGQDALVPTYSLVPRGMYGADSLFDPLVSWSPDSKSLLLTAKSNKTYKQWILRWKVGEKNLEKVCQGMSPNYVDNDRFLFGVSSPCMVAEYSFSRGGHRMLIQKYRNVEFSRDITSFSYIPERKTLALRFSNFTRYYEPGLVEVDLTGKQIRRLPRETGNGVLDRSTDVDGKRAAEILGELTGTQRVLKIFDVGAAGKGKAIAEGDLGAVAWSPNGEILAFAESNEVKAADASGERIVTVARFPAESTYVQPPFICRLSWSPDSRYLVAIQLLPDEVAGNMMAYVLDMSKLKL